MKKSQTPSLASRSRPISSGVKVLCVSHYYPPHVGGIEVVAREHALTLNQSGYVVSVITSAAYGEKRGISEDESVVVYRMRALNIFDIFFDIPFPLPGFGFIRRLWREVGSADIVHIHDVFYVTSWLAYLFSKLRGKTLFLTQHVGFVEHPARFVMWVEHAVYLTWGAWIFRYVKAVVVYNAHVRAFLAPRVESAKLFEMRNGIDLSLFHPVSESKKMALKKRLHLPQRPLALFVGRFVPKKGVDVLFEARGEEYDIVFAGSGSIKSAWQHAEGVHVLGARKRVELAELYQAADMFVLPTRGEPFTLAMQEAAASGLPIIVGDETAYQASGLDRARITLIEPTVPKLKQAMERIAGDKDLRTRMGEYSYELAKERFDWKKNIDSLVDLYARYGHVSQVVVTTSWDDGHILDLKLAELLRRYDIAGTFYVSPKDHELASEERLSGAQIRALSADFEIGAHTMTHRALTSLHISEAEREMQESKTYLEELLALPVLSFCYPRGAFTGAHARLARNLGFSLARTVQRFHTAPAKDPFMLPTSVHAYDHWSDISGPLHLANFNPFTLVRLYRRWDEQAIRLFDNTLKKGGVFHLWGHSWEIDKNNDWERLERVLKHISNRSGARYVPNKMIV